MTQPTITQIEELGAAIYRETARVTESSEIRRRDDGSSPKQDRLEELRIAAAFNGIALSSARSRAKAL